MTVNYVHVSFGRVLEQNISGCCGSCDKHFLELKETILQVETSNVSWRTWKLGYKESYRVCDQIPPGLFYIYKPEIQMPTSEKSVNRCVIWWRLSCNQNWTLALGDLFNFSFFQSIQNVIQIEKDKNKKLTKLLWVALFDTRIKTRRKASNAVLLWMNFMLKLKRTHKNLWSMPDE